MAALQLACTSLWAGDCDTAVTGGLNVMTNSDIFAGLSRGQFLSKTGNCQVSLLLPSSVGLPCQRICPSYRLKTKK